MADERGDDRERIAEKEERIGRRVEGGEQDIKRRACRREVECGDERHRRAHPRAGKRCPPATDLDRSEPEMAEQERDEAERDRRQSRDMQPVQRQAPVEERQYLRARRGRDPGEKDHAVPEGEARERDHAADLAATEPRGAVDTVARRSPGQEREAQIVTERVAGERRQRGGSPRQLPADHAQCETVVKRQEQIACGGER